MANRSHLLVPAASGAVETPSDALRSLALPNLRRLLARMTPVSTIETRWDGPSMPYELALAAAVGLPVEPGRIPMAAYETSTLGVPCAFITLCHWQAGMDQVQLVDPAALALTEDESVSLLAAAQPWFAQDGIALAHHAPGVWLATGEPFRALVTTSLDRVVGRGVSREMLQSLDQPGSMLPRLQSEMQMLLYDHPATDARLRQRKLFANAIWITGAGMLTQPVAAAPGVFVENRLRDVSLQGHDPAAFEAAWREVDAGRVADLLQQVESGADGRLTLAGERRATTFAPRSGGLLSRLAQQWRNADVTASVLGQL